MGLSPKMQGAAHPVRYRLSQVLKASPGPSGLRRARRVLRTVDGAGERSPGGALRSSGGCAATALPAGAGREARAETRAPRAPSRTCFPPLSPRGHQACHAVTGRGGHALDCALRPPGGGRRHCVQSRCSARLLRGRVQGAPHTGKTQIRVSRESQCQHRAGPSGSVASGTQVLFGGFFIRVAKPGPPAVGNPSGC